MIRNWPASAFSVGCPETSVCRPFSRSQGNSVSRRARARCNLVGESSQCVPFKTLFLVRRPAGRRFPGRSSSRQLQDCTKSGAVKGPKRLAPIGGLPPSKLLFRSALTALAAVCTGQRRNGCLSPTLRPGCADGAAAAESSCYKFALAASASDNAGLHIRTRPRKP